MLSFVIISQMQLCHSNFYINESFLNLKFQLIIKHTLKEILYWFKLVIKYQFRKEHEGDKSKID